MKKIAFIAVCLLFTGMAQAQVLDNLWSYFATRTVSEEDGSAILKAVQQKDMATINRLLDKHSQHPRFLINYQDAEGNTPLLYAVQNNDLDMVKFLVSKDADPNIVNAKNWTALCYAVQKNQNGMAIYLLDKKAKADYECGKKATYDVFYPLFDMMQFGNFDMALIAKLVKHGAKVNYASPYENVTPLMMAAQAGELEVMKFLVAFGANVWVRSDSCKGKGQGAPVAFYPIYGGHLDALKYLLEECKAPLMGYYEVGHVFLTPLDVAEHNENAAMIEYLKSKGYTEHGYTDYPYAY